MDDELEVCDPCLQIASMQVDLSPISEPPGSTCKSKSMLYGAQTKALYFEQK